MTKQEYVNYRQYLRKGAMPNEFIKKFCEMEGRDPQNFATLMNHFAQLGNQRLMEALEDLINYLDYEFNVTKVVNKEKNKVIKVF